MNLDAPAKQSDGTLATPFEQAKRYRDWLPASEQGRYIVVCNFRELRLHDMETPKTPPRILQVEQLRRSNLLFLVKPERKQTQEEKISLEAGRLVGRLYRAVLAKYLNPDDEGFPEERERVLRPAGVSAVCGGFWVVREGAVS